MARSPRRLWLATLMAAWLASGGITPALAQGAEPAVTITDLAGRTVPLSWLDLQALPAAEATLGEGRYVTGPTLWSVLERAGAVDPDFHKRVNQTVVATGRDGYRATLAMGEIDPEFEHKPVLLALDAERHMLRLAVPGDKRLGRDVRDAVGVAVR